MGQTAILFPGQGAQSVGMGRELAERLPAARAVFDLADETLGLPLSRLCFAGPAEELNRTDICQAAVFAVSLAALEGLKAEQPAALDDAAAAAGLSLGEYTAYAFAGALAPADGLKLVRERGLAMQAACDARPGGMASVLGLAPEKVEEICAELSGEGQVLVAANYNSPVQVVVSGDAEAVAAVRRPVKAAGGRAIPLKVAGAFHSPLMAPAADRLKELLAGTAFSEPRLPVIANVSGEPVTTAAGARRALAEQLTAPVRWVESMRRLAGDGCRRGWEVGPGKVLAGLMAKIDSDFAVQSYCG